MSQTEGNSGTKNFEFTVSLSKPSSQTVTVTYTTQDGTANWSDNDYWAVLIPEGSTLAIQPGDLSGTISVEVVGDTKVEQNETFFVTLLNANGASIGDSQGMGTILNADQLARDSNDQIGSEAVLTSLGSTVSGAISASGTLPDPGTDAGDVDMYGFTVTAGQRVGFDIDRTSGNLNSYIRLFNARDGTGGQ